MMMFMVVISSVWITTCATSIQQEDSQALSQCMSHFHDCVSRTPRGKNGNIKLRQALAILKSLDSEEITFLDDQEIQLLVNQVKILKNDAFENDKDIIGSIEEIRKGVENEKIQKGVGNENKFMKNNLKSENFANSAFTVELCSRRSISDQVPLTFDNILQDGGENFNTLFGTYTCPEPGVYVFYWSVDAPEGRVQTVLMKNGEPQKYGPLTPDIPDGHSGTSTMSAIVECDLGDLVWIKVQAWPDEEACNLVEAKYTSFSGFKIYNSAEDPRASAFTAQLSQNSSFVSPHIVIYDTEIVNIGNDYSPTNGLFVCREKGPHAFTVSVHRLYGSPYFFLRKNGDIVMYIAHAHNPVVWGESGTSSGTAVIDCVPGDVITMTDIGPYENMANASSLTGYHLIDDQGAVAFTAIPSIPRNYSDGQQIDYDKVITNIGNSYFPGISTFVCKDNALYFFSWEIWNFPENNYRPAAARLMMAKDGERIVIKTGPRNTRLQATNGGRSASTQAIVQCEENAALYIEAVLLSGTTTTYDENFNYFTGFRLPSFN